MDTVKKIFPFAFVTYNKDSFIKFVIMCVVGLIVCAVAGALFGLIPIVRIVTNIVFWVASIYIAATLILGILVFLEVIKK